MFRMMRVSASKFGEDQRDEIIDKFAILPEGGWGQGASA